jgi:hypothetical protein
MNTDLRIRLTVTLGLLAVLGLYLAPACKKDAASDVPPPPPEGSTSFDENFDFTALPSDYPAAMAEVRKAQPWATRDKAIRHHDGEDAKDPRTFMELKMNRKTLEESFALGSAFLINWQLPEGNFRYMYDWVEGTWVEDDNQVRQAGSLWGVALCHRYEPKPATREALDKGLQFWFDNTVEGPEGTLTLKYKEDRNISSGTVALVALSLIEYLMTDEPMEEEYKTELTAKLKGYLDFLQWMQLDDGHISRDYRHDAEDKVKRSSPYYDGESLLCLCKAARQLGYTEYVPTIETTARATAETYTIGAWPKDIDSKQTKGFYQWSSMSFLEYYQAQWKDYELFADVTLSLGWWMTHTHATLKKRRNHAYAVEGLNSAYLIARMRGDVPAQIDLLYTLDRSLEKLSSWQINGPLAPNNSFLVANPNEDPMALGGVMNARKPSGAEVKKDVSHQLRIDVTQHQMHAVTMALEEIYEAE